MGHLFTFITEYFVYHLIQVQREMDYPFKNTDDFYNKFDDGLELSRKMKYDETVFNFFLSENVPGILRDNTHSWAVTF